MSLSEQLAAVKLKKSKTQEKRRRVVINPETGEQEVEFYWVEVDISTGEVKEINKAVKKEEYKGHSKPLLEYIANGESGTWKPVSTDNWKTEASSSLSSSSPLSTFNLLTHNVWFGPTTIEESEKFNLLDGVKKRNNGEKIDGVYETREHKTFRAQKMVDRFRQCSFPEVICLQEVQKSPFLEVVQSDNDVREKYYMVAAFRGGAFEYGLAMLLRKDFVKASAPTVNIAIHDFTGFTRHSRMVMIAEISFSTGQDRSNADPSKTQGGLTIATTHLDSEIDNHENRIKQLGYIAETVGKKSNDKVIICGDMNFGQNSKEQKLFFSPASQKKHQFADCWERTHANMEVSNEEQNTTFDRDFIDNGRIDRVFAAGLEPLKCDIIGEDITVVEEMPSDHYGLLCEFRC